ncbi:MAG TPA: helix-turn-helix domain-containing protein [Acidimicrobiales bacterium]|nr:helix-turn-helix domain-containing protein [Acidimicrobiales bacterium]
MVTTGTDLSPEAQAERARLMDAALKVMRVNGFQAASVQDILDEAGLSTRAFYRQFRSKDDLLLAMFRTASARDVDAVAKRVREASNPMDGLLAWVDEMLSIAFDRRRLSRMVMFNNVARQMTDFDEEVAYVRAALSAPLVEVLSAGAADKTFPSTDPQEDASTIFDLLWSVAGPARQLGRESALEHLLRFCLPALGVATD